MRCKLGYILVVIFLLISCETKWGKYHGYKLDYDSELQYYIVLDKTDTTAISEGDSRENITPYPGAFLKLHSNDRVIDTLFFGKGTIVISTYVKEVKYDDSFIIVDQTLLSKLCECNPHCLEEEYGIGGYSATSFNLCRNALENSDIHDYWIIDKRTDDIYGPYELVKYLIMRNKLNIPPKLKLKTESR
mgnify:CR=1